MKKLLLVLLILSGCARTAIYNHPTKLKTDFKKDWVDCQVKTNQAGYNTSDGWGIPYRRFMQTCMEGEGWIKEE